MSLPRYMLKRELSVNILPPVYRLAYTTRNSEVIKTVIIIRTISQHCNQELLHSYTSDGKMLINAKEVIV